MSYSVKEIIVNGSSLEQQGMLAKTFSNYEILNQPYESTESLKESINIESILGRWLKTDPIDESDKHRFTFVRSNSNGLMTGSITSHIGNTLNPVKLYDNKSKNITDIRKANKLVTKIPSLKEIDPFFSDDTHVLFLDNPEIVNAFTVKAFKLNNLYKGSTDVNPEQVTVKREDLFKNDYLFFATVTREIIYEKYKDTVSSELFRQYVPVFTSSLDKILKYTKSRAWLKHFITEVLTNYEVFLSTLINNSPHLKEFQEYTETHSIANFFPELTLPTTPHTLIRDINNKDFISSEAFIDASIVSKIQNASVTKEYSSLFKKASRVSASLKAHKRNVLNLQKTVHSYEKDLSSLLEKIDRYKKDQEVYKTNLTETENKVKILETELNEFNTQLTAKKESVAKLKEKLKSTVTQDWIATYLKEGILIQSIQFIDQHGYTFYLKDVPDAFINDAYEISEIKFATTDPICITPIDNTNNVSGDAVAGGPYNFKIVKQGGATDLYVALSDPRGIVAKDTHDMILSIHPHVTHICYANEPNKALAKLNQFHKVCLGELAQPLYHAVKAKNINFVIQSVLAWARTAYTYDYWGKRYKYFPKYDTVKHPKKESIIELFNKNNTPLVFKINKKLTNGAITYDINVSGATMTLTKYEKDQEPIVTETTYSTQNIAMETATAAINKLMLESYQEVEEIPTLQAEDLLVQTTSNNG